MNLAGASSLLCTSLTAYAYVAEYPGLCHRARRDIMGESSGTCVHQCIVSRVAEFAEPQFCFARQWLDLALRMGESLRANLS